VLTTCQPSTVWCSRERLPAAAAQPAKVRQSCSATDYYYFAVRLFCDVGYSDYTLYRSSSYSGWAYIWAMNLKKVALQCNSTRRADNTQTRDIRFQTIFRIQSLRNVAGLAPLAYVIVKPRSLNLFPATDRRIYQLVLPSWHTIDYCRSIGGTVLHICNCTVMSNTLILCNT
jgi:hypothetical protein